MKPIGTVRTILSKYVVPSVVVVHGEESHCSHYAVARKVLSQKGTFARPMNGGEYSPPMSNSSLSRGDLCITLAEARKSPLPAGLG